MQSRSAQVPSTDSSSKKKKKKRPAPPATPPPNLNQSAFETSEDINAVNAVSRDNRVKKNSSGSIIDKYAEEYDDDDDDESLNPFNSVETAVTTTTTTTTRKKKDVSSSSKKEDTNNTFMVRRYGYQDAVEVKRKPSTPDDVNGGYLLTRYKSLKPTITWAKAIGFLVLDIGLACAFISGYTMMGKGVHVYEFLNKDAHYDAAWYIGVSCFGIFFLLWLLDADVILRHQSKIRAGRREIKKFEKTEKHGDDADESDMSSEDDNVKEKEKKSNNNNNNINNSQLPITMRNLSANDLLEAAPEAVVDYKIKALVLNLIILICGVGMLCAAILASGRYVTAPVVIYVLVKIGMMAVYKKKLCRGISTRSFMVSASKASFIAGALIIGAWFFWVFQLDNNWDKEKYAFPNRVFECDTSLKDGTDSGCVSVYMMWMLPGATGFLEFLFGATANFLSRPGGAVRMIAVLMMIFGLGTYIQVSIAGVEMGIADDIIQFVVLFVGMFLMLLFAAAGRKKIAKIVKGTGIETKVQAATNHPIMKGFLLCAVGPVLPAGMLISAVASACRRIGLTFRPKVLDSKIPEDEKDGLITHECRQVLYWLFDSPTQTIVYATWIALSYFILSIGVGKGAVIFLAWLVSYLQKQAIWIVFVIFFAIGVFMFLLPPIPGPPVYLTGGIVIVGALEESMGFWGGVAICGLMCWFVKLFSCMLQQKCIGEPLGNKVSIRAMCAVNTPQMRAIKVILLQKGLPIDKLAVLCGGPDWPTSVLCGIIRVPLHEAMLGTAPVIVLYLMYVVISGAVQLKIGGCEVETISTALLDSESQAENYWQLLNAVMLALSAVSMGITMFGFAYFMDKAMVSRKDEIDAVPIDIEVEEYEKQQEEMQIAYKKVSEWGILPASQKVLLCIACVFSIGSAQFATVMASECFEEFGVACEVSVMDVVTLWGWVVLGVHTLGLMLMYLYGKIQQRAARKFIESDHSLETA
jgi:hypothetical protein